MINYIVGEIEEKKECSIVLESNGIGYEIFATAKALTECGCVGEKAKIYTYLNVREDEMSLFGFATAEEKELFLKLISVSGIGPKVAISILSGIKLSDLVIAIKTEDTKLLTTVKGLGKKTAERIVLELKDKINLFGFEQNKTNFDKINMSIVDEATDALVALGLNKNDAYKLARDNAVGATSSEEIIRKSFQNFN